MNLRPFRDDDAAFVERWLYMPHVAAWYKHPDHWLRELRERHGAFSFLAHFIAEHEGVPFGFCQYYDTYFALEHEVWNDEPDVGKKQGEIFSIDYLIGEVDYLRRGFGKEMVMQMLGLLREAGAKTVIVEPEKENIASNRTLEASGFAWNGADYHLELGGTVTSIRNEQPADYRRVEEITREAFWDLYVPGASEHYLVHTMRQHADYLPELSFVLEEDGELVGSIHFTRAWVDNPAGEAVPVVHFGPVCITPELHRQGYGRKLITHAIEAARAGGHRATVLGGFPYHYHPYGFAGTKKYGIAMEDGKFYTGIMALPLYDGALDGVTGKLRFSAALYPDESGLEAYEATFLPKEKQVLPCQKAFEAASSELDEQVYD